MTGHFAPVGLVQILAGVHRLGMILGEVVNSQAPVVGGPDNFKTGLSGPFGEAAGSGEQINCSAHSS